MWVLGHRVEKRKRLPVNTGAIIVLARETVLGKV